MATVINVLMDNKTQTIILESFWTDVISFGSGTECDIELSKPYVSSLHGCFFYDQGSWHYKDLNSENGIYKNGIKRSEEPLNEGDELVICESPTDFDKIKISVCSSEETDLDKTDNLKSGDNKRTVVESSSKVPETSKKSKSGLFVAIGLIAVIGIVALVFGLRKNSKDNVEDSVVAEATTEVVPETTEALVAEPVEEATEEMTVEPTEEPTEAIVDSNENDTENLTASETDAVLYTEDGQLTEQGALEGVKNYYFKCNPEMTGNADAQNSWNITSSLLEEGSHVGCIEIEYVAFNSENDAKTYYYVDKASGAVAIEEYVDGIRIKSSESFNVNSYLD